MTLIILFAILVIASLLVGLSLAIGVRRVVRERVNQRYELRASKLRPAMLRLLSEDEPDTAALDQLVGRHDKFAENLAWSLLPKVRGGAREVLAQWLQGRGAVDRARRRTRAPGAVMRSRAAEHLGAAGMMEAAPDVIRLLGDRRPEVRIVAARALGKLGHSSAVPHLLDALDGRRYIPMSLVSMALIHIGPSAIDELVLGLGRRSARSRAVCAELLGIHGAFQAAKWLLLLVESDAVDEVRVRAAASLGRLGAPQGIAPLLRALAPDQSRPLRVAAARSLGQIGGAEAVSGLHHAVQDSTPEVASAAAEALAGLGQSGAQVLTLVAEGADVSARRAQDWLARMDLEGNRHRRRTRTATRGGGAR